ncbi:MULTISPECIES: LacI family DNA-binding transcriptional regulator [unclassified Corynebacterium]|uniref:LacI family DNA-binding transcriptional regulator n=1 Tax=unclassified Corynebacterium TaxID=2624378 RepID=UPI001FEE474D|nr:MULTISPECIES: LacI family DNA-binding transcriptional regulator [unclassified Corynebacterium]
MNTSANLKDVAAAAGVSVSTASRALAGKTIISEDTRNRVQAAAQKLNYKPNIQARGLRTARTYTIGLSIPTLVNPFFATMAAAIQENATAHGLSTIITSYDEDALTLKNTVNALYQHQVDGMIVVPSAKATQELEHIAQLGVPLVLIDRVLTDCSLPAVVSHPDPGIYAALEHLVEQGHHHIGFLAGPAELSTGAGRLQAFRTAHAALLDNTQEHIFYGGFEVTQGHRGARALLDAGATAIIAGDSMMTLGAMEYCHAHEVHIGDDVALVGFDDLVYMRVQPTPLSVIDQDVVAMGQQAVQLLVNWMSRAQPPPEQEIIAIDTTFIPRASTTKGTSKKKLIRR